jgi:hypothetical protein
MVKSNLPLDLSPKVAAFLAAVGGPGIILLIVGIVIDNEELRAAGIALLGGGVLGTPVAYKAPVGDVVEEVGVPSDGALSEEAINALNAEEHDTVVRGAQGPAFSEAEDPHVAPPVLPGEDPNQIGRGAGDPPTRPV